VYFEPVNINPVMGKYFAGVFPTFSYELPSGGCAFQSQLCTYDDIAALPWAPPDMMDLNHPRRLAFMREEASWRKMYVTQHPIGWIDWWHEWDTRECRSDSMETIPVMAGNGNARRNDQFVILGVLWDIMEARLLRGCALQAFMYPNGCPYLDDQAIPEGYNSVNTLLFDRMPDG
jgi:hypothetical protein